MKEALPKEGTRKNFFSRKLLYIWINMADDPKKSSPAAIDDWDSLPLDPESSWDAIPAPGSGDAEDETPEAFGGKRASDYYSPLKEGPGGAPSGAARDFEADDSFLGEAPEEPEEIFGVTEADEGAEDEPEPSDEHLDEPESSDEPLDEPSDEPESLDEHLDEPLDEPLEEPLDEPLGEPKDSFGGRLSGEDLLDFPQRDDLELDEEKLSQGFKGKAEREESAGAEDSWDAEVPEGTGFTESLGDKGRGADSGRLAAVKPAEPELSKRDAKAPRDPILGPEEPGDGIEHDVDRTRFLESLMEDGEKVPRKVELDLDGIFSQAQKEAEKLSPDSTHSPETPPLPPMETDPDMPAPPPEPLSEPKVRKVSKFKLLFLLLPIIVGALALMFGIYEIFIKSPPKVETPLIVLDPDAKRELVPGEMTLQSFYFTLEGSEEDPSPAVTELEIILHYHDQDDVALINDNLVTLRDMIFRIAKANGKTLLSDPDLRRKLQADLLSTLHEQPFLKNHKGADGEESRVLTYVQISRLRKVNV
jgi:hypothetical protein